jgi:hypothetical protein
MKPAAWWCMLEQSLSEHHFTRQRALLRSLWLIRALFFRSCRLIRVQGLFAKNQKFCYVREYFTEIIVYMNTPTYLHWGELCYRSMSRWIWSIFQSCNIRFEVIGRVTCYSLPIGESVLVKQTQQLYVRERNGLFWMEVKQKRQN